MTRSEILQDFNLDIKSLFDETYYVLQLPKEHLKKTKQLLHYLNFGERFGLKPNRFFDPIFYLSQNQNLDLSSIGLLEHFCEVGWKQYRDPSPLFSVEYYLSTNEDVRLSQLNPLVHYLNYGRKENRKPNEFFSSSVKFEPDFITSTSDEGSNLHLHFDYLAFFEATLHAIVARQCELEIVTPYVCSRLKLFFDREAELSPNAIYDSIYEVSEQLHIPKNNVEILFKKEQELRELLGSNPLGVGSPYSRDKATLPSRLQHDMLNDVANHPFSSLEDATVPPKNLVIDDAARVQDGSSLVALNTPTSTLFNALFRKRFGVTQANMKNNWALGSPTALGYKAVGPAILGFAQFILDQAIKQKVTKLYFLARDGYHTMRIVQRLVKNAKLNLEVRYLYCSRTALIQSSMQNHRDIESALEHDFRPCRMKELLGTRLGLTPEEISQMGLSPESTIENTLERRNALLQQIKSRSPTIIKKARAQKRAFKMYLSSLGIDSNSFVIDLGYRGTAQKSINKVLNIKAKGLYLLCDERISEQLDENLWQSYLPSTYPRESSTFNNISMLEILFSSNRSTTIGYEEDWPGPKFSTMKSNSDMTHMLSLIHKGVDWFVSDYQELFEYPESLTPGESLSDIFEFLESPNPLDALLFQDFEFEDVFGQDYRQLLNPDEPEFSIWKPGADSLTRLSAPEEISQIYRKLFSQSDTDVWGISLGNYQSQSLGPASTDLYALYKSTYFDANYYRAINQLPNTIDAYIHFLRVGFSQGLSPSSRWSWDVFYQYYPELRRTYPPPQVRAMINPHYTKFVTPSYWLPTHSPIPGSQIAPKSNPVKSMAVFSHNLEREGAPLFLFNLVRNLQKNLSIKVFSFAEGELRKMYEELDIRVEVIPQIQNCQNSDEVIQWANLLIATHKLGSIDVFYGNTIICCAVGYIAKLVGARAMLHIHESEPATYHVSALTSWPNNFVAACFQLASKIIFVSHAAASVYREYLSRDNSIVLHNPSFVVKTDIIQGTDNRIRKLVNLREGERLILSVGTICARKGQIEAISAIETLPECNFHFVFCGRIDSEIFPDLVDALNRLPSTTREKIHFTGAISNVSELYASSDFFLFTSRLESYPTVIQEAIAWNLPLISTDIPSVRELVPHDYPVRYYKCGNPMELQLILGKLEHVPSMDSSSYTTASHSPREYANLITTILENSEPAGFYPSNRFLCH